MRRTVLVAVGIVGAGAVGVGVSLAVWHSAVPVGLSIVNGRIEGDPVVVAAKVPGRVITLHVKEGDAVGMDQPIAEISSEQIRARVDQAAAVKTSAINALDSARAAAMGARNQLGRAEAGNAAAAARQEKAAKDAGRAEELFRRGVLAQAEIDEARATREVAAADRRAAAQQVAATQRAIESADAQVAAAQGQVQAAAAALDESQSTLTDTKVRSPARGVVTTKVAEQGEVLAAGAPIVVVTDLDQLHMKAYVPEPEIGRIKIGDPAQVHVDAFPGRPFAARVREIASQSEFTPKEVQTREERVKQVVAVKLYLDTNPGHALIPGMPADAVIRWKPEVAWVDPAQP
ncbi:MAG: HlyD family secretion protein [Candidatus Binatia bacterium]